MPSTNARPLTSAKARRFTESVIREMTRLAAAHGAVNLAQGFPDFAAPEAIKEAAWPRSAPTSTSTRSPGARSRCGRRSPAAIGTPTGCELDPERNRHGVLRLDRGDDRDAARPRRSRRRGHRLRAVLRELRARRDPLGRDAALRARSREPDWTLRPGRAAGRVQRRAPARSSSTRRTTRPARSSRARSSRRSPRCASEHDVLAITDEIYEHILYDGARARPDRHAAGHGASARSRSTACRRPTA